VALIVLFIAYALEDHHWPSPVSDEDMAAYKSLHAGLIRESEERNSEKGFYEKGLELVDLINQNKRSIWPTTAELQEERKMRIGATVATSN
jgi:hypothetical protein